MAGGLDAEAAEPFMALHFCRARIARLRTLTVGNGHVAVSTHYRSAGIAVRGSSDMRLQLTHAAVHQGSSALGPPLMVGCRA